MIIMTDSVTGQRTNPFNWGTLSFMACMLLPVAVPQLLPYLSAYLWAVLALQLFLLSEFIVSFLNQATGILGIRLFSIKPKID